MTWAQTIAVLAVLVVLAVVGLAIFPLSRRPARDRPHLGGSLTWAPPTVSPLARHDVGVDLYVVLGHVAAHQRECPRPDEHLTDACDRLRSALRRLSA